MGDQWGLELTVVRMTAMICLCSAQHVSPVMKTDLQHTAFELSEEHFTENDK